MIWARKGVVWLLALFLFVSLLGMASYTSFNHTLGQPHKVEQYLDQSRIYDHFISYVAKQTAKTEGDEQPGSVSLSDTAVLAAAKASFPPSLIQDSVNTFIDANYVWLEGKTTKPEFKVDLSKAKETFAQKVGHIVKVYTAGLPVCQGKEAAIQKKADPLAATCRQKNVTPTQVGDRAAENLRKTGDFLSDPVITADAVNPKGNQEKQPYYERLSQLPKAFRTAKKLPYILGLLSVLFAAGIVLIALTRRKGLRRLGLVLILAGAVLIVFKFTSDAIINSAKNHIFNDTSVGELQKSLTDFLHRVASSMTRTDLLFGIVFLILGIIILVTLLATRDTTPRIPGEGGSGDAGDDNEPVVGGLPLLKARKRFMRPFGDSIMPLGARPGGPEDSKPAETEAPQPKPGKPSTDIDKPEEPVKPKRRKKPRLIQ